MRRAALLGLVLLAGCGGGHAGGPVGSTLSQTWRDDGSGTPVRAAGEPLRDRTQLGPAATPGATLATIGVLTDTHVRDEESPARVAFLDRLGGPFTATFRPQEALTTQVLDAAVTSLDAQRPDATVLTGDLIDNDQADELQQALTTLKGGRVDPDTGARGYDGVQQADDPDPSYYRPEVDPPREPGLLTAAQRPFTARGLTGKLLAVPGNHDVLVAGEVAATPQTDAIAVGDRRLTEPDSSIEIPRDERLARPAVDRLLRAGTLPGTTVHTPADPGRREITAQQWLDAARAKGVIAGSGARADSVLDVGARVRIVTLDVTRRDGLSGGVVVPGQSQFLARALRTDRWVIVATHQPLRKVAGSAPIVAQLEASPRVIATLNGDTHHNRIAPHAGSGGGYWEITTSALADWPQQARVLRVRATAGGGVAIETSMLDTAPGRLPDVARELALIDAQGGRPGGNAGTRADRNARLFRAP